MTTVQTVGVSTVTPSLAQLDPETAVGVVSMQIQDKQVDQAKGRAQSLSTKREIAINKAREALHEAMDSDKDGGLFSNLVSKLETVAEVAGVVASVAAIATGVGAPVGALMLTGLALSGAGLAMKATNTDADLGEVKIFGAHVDVHLSDVFELTGAVASGAGAVAGGAGAAASATEKGSAFWATTRTVSLAGQSAALGGAAYFTVRAGRAKADAVDFQADAQSQRADADQAKSDFEDQVDVARGAMGIRARVTATIGDMMAERATATRYVGERMRG